MARSHVLVASVLVAVLATHGHAQPASPTPPPESTPAATAVAGAEEGAPGAGAAHDALVREIASARAHRQNLAELAAELGRRREALDESSAIALEEFSVLAEGVRSAASGSAEMDGIFDRLDQVLVRERPALRAALDQLGAPSEVPSWRPSIRLEAYEMDRFLDELEQLRRLMTDIDVAVDELTATESELRWLRVEQLGRRVAGLNQLRLEALAELSEPRRRELMALGRDGVAQLAAEVEQLVSDTRLYWLARRHEIGSLRTQMSDVFTLGSFTVGVIKVLLTLLLALWLVQHWRDLLARGRSHVARSLRSLRWKRRAVSWITSLEEVAPWLVVLLILMALRWSLGELAARPLLRLPLAVLFLYAGYRLAIDLFVHLIVRVAGHYRLRLLDEYRTKLIRSVRWIMRVVAAIAVLLMFSEQSMGRGCLYNVIQELSWVAVAITALLILVSWRRVLADTYLQLQPTGSLSRMVRASRDRWSGVLLAPASFIWLAGRASIAVARDFAMGFEQTGKVLAFLFRRKVEKQAETRGYAEAELEKMPAEILEAFSERPVDRGELVVPHFPALDQLRRDISAWRDGGFAGSFLLTGERGVGKSSWLNQVRRDDVEVTRLSLDHRLPSPGRLTRFLAAGMELPATQGRSVEKLAATLCEGPRRLVIVDLSQHLFLAAVGGYATFAAFAELVNRTRRQVYWLCSMNAYAWRHLSAVRADAAVFRTRIHLQPWNEKEVRELINRRCDASGLRFNYADLVVNEMEGISYRSSVVESAESYTRLLWDYADGNPRAALHHFVRSLELERPGRVRVRMFRAPDPAQLEEGGEPGMFLLAAIVTHESIDLADLAAVTRFPLQDCHIHLDRLRDLGAVEVDDGMFRIATQWHRAVVRLLKRRNYIPD